MKREHWFRLIVITAMVAVGAAGLVGSQAQAQGGGTLGYGSKVFGTLSADMPRITYSFNGSPGDLVTVDVESWSGTLDPFVELVAPGGEVLGRSLQNSAGGDPLGAQLSVFLSEAGIYSLWITGQNDSTGDFLLVLQGRSLITNTTLAYGQAVDVSIPVNAPPQYYTFETQDCPTTLTITNLGQGQPFTFPFVVKVRDQRGQPVALLRGGEAQEDWVTVAPESGWYEVEVLANDPALEGSLRLLVTCSSDAPGCTGQPGIAGIAGGAEDCTPCPGGVTLTEGGGCPDLHLTAEKDTLNPFDVRVTWDALPGADSYLLRAYGIIEDGEVYLGLIADDAESPLHEALWHFPEDFVAFRFVLQVIRGGDVICTQEVVLEYDQDAPLCEGFTVTGAITSSDPVAATWTWTGYPGADFYAGYLYHTTEGGEVFMGAGAYESSSTAATTPLAENSGIWRFVVGVIQDGEMICWAESRLALQGADEPIPACEDFTVSIVEQTGTSVTLEWSEYPGAEQYALSLLGDTGALLPGYPVLVSSSQHSITLDTPGPGSYTFVVGPWIAPDGMICEQEIPLQTTAGDAPCGIIADRGDVRVHVGPGRERGVFGYLTPGTEYIVTGQAVDAAGNVWWQIDKTQFPGHEEVISLWVAQGDVIAVGDCSQVPDGDIPPVIPDGEESPGTWLPCGSCDTCGHPANECVTSPEGQCLWDPATCQNAPPPDEGGDDVPPDEQQPVCVGVFATVDPPGTGSAGPITPGNCGTELYGVYTAGSSVQVRANPNAGCWLDHWSGCGASGNANPVTITVNSTCTITAHIACIG